METKETFLIQCREIATSQTHNLDDDGNTKLQAALKLIDVHTSGTEGFAKACTHIIDYSSYGRQ